MHRLSVHLNAATIYGSCGMKLKRQRNEASVACRSFTGYGEDWEGVASCRVFVVSAIWLSSHFIKAHGVCQVPCAFPLVATANGQKQAFRSNHVMRIVARALRALINWCVSFCAVRLGACITGDVVSKRLGANH